MTKRTKSPKRAKSPTLLDPGELLTKLVGRWSGTAKTWFEPGTPVITAPISGHIYRVLKAQSIGHTYSTKINGRLTQGLAIIGRDLSNSRFCISWVDTFHTNADVMLFQRDERALTRGFSVRGQYAVGPDDPKWGWRTTYQLKGDSRLEILHYNITPDGYETMAIKISYQRVAAARGKPKPKTSLKDRVGAPRRAKS